MGQAGKSAFIGATVAGSIAVIMLVVGVLSSVTLLLAAAGLLTFALPKQTGGRRIIPSHIHEEAMARRRDRIAANANSSGIW